mgnify:CR=1 FL=1|jgi:mannosyltransferase OCH1-like enzyme
MNIIQTWKDGNIPYEYIPFRKSVEQNKGKWNYMFFTDSDIELFMNNFAYEYKDVYDNFPHKIQRIDFFRYLAIYQFGGVYLDLDILLKQSLDDILKTPNVCKFPIEIDQVRDTIITRNNFHSLIGNYAFYAPAKHPFIKQIIDNIVNERINKNDIELAQSTNGDSNEQVYVYCTTGPIMVTQSYIDYNNKSEVELIKSTPFINDSFGNYGIHCCYGSWK